MSVQKNPQYTIQRITKADRLFGPIHGTEQVKATLCGREIDYNWYVLTTNYDGEVTCKRCLKEMKNLSRKQNKQ